MPYRVHYGLMRIEAALFLLVLIICIIPASAQIQVCGQETLYFEHNKTPDITNYEGLLNYPSGESQVEENITIKDTDGPVLIDTYIMPAGSLNEAHTLLKGLRVFNTVHYVDSAVGVTRINFTAFQRFSNGTEVVFYSQLSDDINSLSPDWYTTYRISQQDLPLNPTDRLGIKIYGQTTHSSPIKLYFIYQGSTNTSHFESGYFDCEPIITPTIPNLPAKEPGFSGEQIIISGGLLALFLIFIVLRGR